MSQCWKGRRQLAVCLLLVAPSRLGAQDPCVALRPQAMLLGERVRLEGTYLRVRHAVELSPDAWLLLDGEDKTVYRATPKSSSRVSRRGSGPNEYLEPTALFSSTSSPGLIYDGRLRRLIRVDRRGAPLGQSGTSAVAGFGVVRGVDGAGALYGEGMPPGVSEGKPSMLPIVRWMPSRGDRVDTVARFSSAPIIRVTQRTAAMVTTLFQPDPFATEEIFVVAPDGTIARAVPEPLRVIRVSQGASAERASSCIDAPRRRFTEEDAEELATPALRPGLTAPPNAPVFRRDGVRVAPDGEVWVELYRRPSQKVGMIVIFPTSGSPCAMEISGQQRVVAIAATRVLWAERSEASDEESAVSTRRPVCSAGRMR